MGEQYSEFQKEGADIVAIEADKTILLDQVETVELANRYSISIVALSRSDAA